MEHVGNTSFAHRRPAMRRSSMITAVYGDTMRQCFAEINPNGSTNLYGELRTYLYRFNVCGFLIVAEAVIGSIEVYRPWARL